MANLSPDMRLLLKKDINKGITKLLYHTATKVCPHSQHIWTIDSCICYTGNIGRRITDQASVQTLSQPFSVWMTKQPSLSEAPGRTHRSRHSKSMDNKYFTLSFTHSLRYIRIYDRDLHQPFQVPHSIDKTMHTSVLRSHAQLHDCISNSAISSNNFMSLLSDL